MESFEIESDIRLFRGGHLDSNATALIRGREVLLIDGMGSRAEAEQLRRVLENDLGLSVRFILSTHYFSDHMAAFGLFPGAEILAHRFALQTFWSEEFRTEEERGHFVEPSILISDDLSWRWGRYVLEIFHNPGHTMSTLNVHVPEADLLFAADEAVGNMAYVHYSTPELISLALRRARARGARRVVLGHGGVNSASVLENAGIYLDRLGDHVRGTRAGAGEFERIADIPLESCLARGVEATEFERFFHARNLRAIAARGLYPDPREPGFARAS